LATVHDLEGHYERRLAVVPSSIRGPLLEYVTVSKCGSKTSMDALVDCLYRHGSADEWIPLAHMRHVTNYGSFRGIVSAPSIVILWIIIHHTHSLFASPSRVPPIPFIYDENQPPRHSINYLPYPEASSRMTGTKTTGSVEGGASLVSRDRITSRAITGSSSWIIRARPGIAAGAASTSA